MDMRLQKNFIPAIFSQKYIFRSEENVIKIPFHLHMNIFHIFAKCNNFSSFSYPYDIFFFFLLSSAYIYAQEQQIHIDVELFY